MDIAAISMAMSQQNLMTNVNVAILSKGLDTVEDLGTDMVKMMEQSVQPNLGKNIDITI